MSGPRVGDRVQLTGRGRNIIGDVIKHVEASKQAPLKRNRQTTFADFADVTPPITEGFVVVQDEHGGSHLADLDEVTVIGRAA